MFPQDANTRIMENEANDLTDSFVARRTTDPALRLELLCSDQNSSTTLALSLHNIRPWTVESLEQEGREEEIRMRIRRECSVIRMFSGWRQENNAIRE